MTYKNRYMLRLTLMLSALVAGSATAVAQSETPTGVKVHGNVFGGGNEADVKINTVVNMSTGQVLGNVYGGGNLGDVGTIDKTDQTDYNYKWKNSNANGNANAEGNDNTAGNNAITGTNTNTGICKVNITGGKIGAENVSTANHASGHVFGAGKGSSETWWCEKGIAFATSVSISAGTVYGNVYGGGQVGRVEDDAKVTIGTAGTPASGTEGEEGYVAAVPASGPDIKGDVFGAGAGLATHGYSALVRGNSDVTVQGTAQVGGNVYGGGETASVGRFTVVGGLPKHPDDGGYCTVTIQDNAKIGTSGTGHNVYGACKGVTPEYVESGENRSKSMQLEANKPAGAEGETWDYYTTYPEDYKGTKFIWRYYASEEDYKAFLKTLALTSHPHVTISEEATVYGSVYGGGQRGVTLGGVDVNIVGGTVEQDVYGGGALADTNLGNWDADGYTEVTGLTVGESSVAGLYTRSETEGNYIYSLTTGENPKAVDGTTYYSKGKWHDATQMSGLYTTTVDLTGGLIKGDAYGGGLGQKTGFNSATSDIAAVVWGDIDVILNGTAFYITYDNAGTTEKPVDVVKSGRVFGCNNLWGSPQGDVTVTVNRTVEGNTPRTTNDENGDKRKSETDSDHKYELAAVYGGGNLAPYTTSGKKAMVNIYGCDDTSILTVYGGGNAAPVPETDVKIYSTYEIGSVFGGGNGKDKYKNDNGWQTNPGANVNGNTKTLIYGGTVHEAYGASNEKGTITGSVTIDVADSGLETTDPNYCALDVAKVVGAGKNADVNGDLIMVMGCKPATKIPVLYAGADNANVNGNVELTITSGNFGKVFGGNNESGAIRGHIKLNIEETGTCGTPITIDELYLGGNQAAYSKYGYYVKTTTSEGENASGVGAPTETAILTTSGRLILMPRQSANDPHKSLKEYTFNETLDKWTWEVYSGGEGDTLYTDPELNIIACTRIDNVFGGGYGTGAAMYADPKVNINMIQGTFANNNTVGVPAVMTSLSLDASENTNKLGIIGDVFGGGNAADVIGNPTVNIGTASSVTLTSTDTDETKNVLGAYIVGNVFGGGKGEAKMTEGTAGEAFLCAKAMVNGNIGTLVNIGNGFVRGNVYGGGEVGRVEHNTEVTIGLASGTSTPVISGNVFGAGKGTNTHGYSALVRGHSRVTVQADSKVLGSVYGGGEMASVGKYSVGNDGLPEAMAPDNEHPNSGYCYVTIKGNAEIGPNDMVMNNTTTHKPDDHGHVFGAGMGVLPYEGYASDETPKHMDGTKQNDGSWVDNLRTYPVYNAASELDSDYEKFIKSLALATQTVVTIEGNPFIKGSVYGGSENGYVQKDTKVTISGGQIGNGYVQMDNNGIYLDKLSPAVTPMAVNRRYTDAEWTAGHLIPDNTKEPDLYTLVNEKYYTSSLPECASWQYGAPYAPYDKDADANGDYPSGSAVAKAEGGRPVGSDGHTFYGNVFGGGSGYYPYKPGRWFEPAGAVYGNTEVEITGGHILTNIYGGNEMTDVSGTCTVKFGGTATLGVPRTLKQIDAHPLTCYLFGAGKGDQRIFFNKSTTVEDVVVNVTGGTIYGSIFGGGEDGHVLRNVTMTIGEQTTTGEGDQAVTTTSGPTIGTWGTSYVDGNVFGGGRGFGGDAYTAGNVAGSITMDIKGGTILGSIYGGGRLGSVGYGLFDEGVEGYGEMRPDNTVEDSNPTSATDFKRGYVDITISGGTIGNSFEYIVPKTGEDGNIPSSITETDFTQWTAAQWTTWKEHNNIPKTVFDTSNGRLSHTKGGNVFAGGMGRREQLDGVTPISAIDWHKLGNVKTTKVTISGSAWIKSNVYGGGELGAVRSYYEGSLSEATNIQGGNTEVNVNGGTIGTMIGPSINGGTKDTDSTSGDGRYTFGSVYGGGYGSEKDILDDPSTPDVVDPIPYNKNMENFAALVIGNTEVTMTGGTVLGSVFGGGEVACIGGSTKVEVSGGKVGVKKLKDDGYVLFGGATMGNVFGGGRGSMNAVNAGLVRSSTTVNISGTPEIYHNVYGGGALGSVGWFTFTDGKPTACSDNTGTATVTVTGGTIGYDGKENGMVFGSSRGGEGNPTGSLLDQVAWVKNTVVTIGTAATPASGTEGEEGYIPATPASGPDIKGSVYGGGENGHNFRNSEVTIHGGTIGTNAAATYDNGNVYGAGCGTDTYTEGGVTKYNPMAGCVQGNTSITIDGGLVRKNVYGGGELGLTKGSVIVNIQGGTITEDVYGGGSLADTNTTSSVDTNGDGTADTTIDPTTTVNLKGGTINHNVYGGGLGRLAKPAVAEVLYTAEDAEVIAGTKNVGDVKTPAVDAVSAVEAKVFGNVTVELNKPTDENDDTTYGDCEVKGSIFGCNNLNGSPQKDVTVHIFKTVTKSSGTVQTKPTKNTDKYELTAVYGGGNLAAYYPDGATTSSTAKAKVIIDGCDLTSIKTVYGGGNAASVPATDVIVNGTYEIGQVFGGGNGYDNYQLDGKWYQNPGANVGYKNYTHLGTGTGTAEDLILAVNNTNPDASTKENRIANYAYGIGKAHATIYGGTVHEVYGGSNSRGNVRVEARATLEDLGCDFTVGEAYGGGRNAPQDGDAVLEIGCISGLEKAYGGAANADINGNVVLNITNGTYGQVFGGNNAGGAIRGSITVNIDETGCRPIIIGELYAGGNEAAYSVYGYDADDEPLKRGDTGADTTPAADPQLNVRSFTSIGNIFGGGYGDKATMVASPVVNVNVHEGKYYEQYNGSDNIVGDNARVVGSTVKYSASDDGYATGFPIPSHAKGKIGAIQNVFGGGNAAKVIGNPTVNIGTEAGNEVYAEVGVATGGDVKGLYTRSGEGTNESPYTYTKITETTTAAVSTTYYKKTFKGADIRGNVFGGGNNAEVDGDTNVVIGRSAE